MKEAAAAPLVSVILPTYNRAGFLAEAIDSIRAQRYQHWELIVVDDGSTDETAATVPALCCGIEDRVRYVRQENRGAYAARNAGLELATGDYIAFFDSDDLWLPHHLEACVTALVANPDVDWVYGACQSVDLQTGKILAPSTFYVDGRARPFLALHAEVRGALHVIDDRSLVRCAILQGLVCGLQDSVIRSRVFDRRRFSVDYHNEAEDQLFAIRAALGGRRFGYLDAVHVIYRVHESNSSAPSTSKAAEKRLDLMLELVRGYEDLGREMHLTGPEARALRRRLNREYFWHVGYVLLWEQGRRREALAMFRRGLRRWPWAVSCWKTYLGALVRVGFAREPHA